MPRDLHACRPSASHLLWAAVVELPTQLDPHGKESAPHQATGNVCSKLDMDIWKLSAHQSHVAHIEQAILGFLTFAGSDTIRRRRDFVKLVDCSWKSKMYSKNRLRRYAAIYLQKS